MRIFAEKLSNTAIDILNNNNNYGVLHSIYNHTANVLLANNELITIASNDWNVTPFSIHCNPQIFSYLHLGMELYCGDSFIYLGAHNWIYLTKASVIDLNACYNCLNASVSYSCLLSIVKSLKMVKKSTLCFLIFENDNSGLFSFKKSIIQFLNYLKERKTTNLLKVSGDLIGLGVGLTPAFDDFLVGLTIALISSNNEMAYYWLSTLTKILKQYQDNTTLVSYTFLKYASKGCFSENLLELAKALHYPVNEQICVKSIKRLLAFGHSSGADTLIGIIKGFEIAV